MDRVLLRRVGAQGAVPNTRARIRAALLYRNRSLMRWKDPLQVVLSGAADEARHLLARA